MSGAIQLAEPHVFTNVGLRLMKNDGSTSEANVGETVTVETKGQTNVISAPGGKYLDQLSS